MRRLRLAGMCLAMLLLSAQVGAARVQGQTVKKTAHPIWAVAIDGPRVAYSAGGLIHVWNLAAVGTVKAFGACAIGSRGLVYAVNSRPNSRLGAGKIVFVSRAKLNGLLTR